MRFSSRLLTDGSDSAADDLGASASSSSRPAVRLHVTDRSYTPYTLCLACRRWCFVRASTHAPPALHAHAQSCVHARTHALGQVQQWKRGPVLPYANADAFLDALQLPQYKPVFRSQARRLLRVARQSIVIVLGPTSMLVGFLLFIPSLALDYCPQAIDMHLLLTMSEADLLGLGVHAFGHRRKIGFALQPYRFMLIPG